MIQPRARVLLAGAAALCVGIVVYVVDPHQSSHLPPCPFHALTGLFCPGCGSTRAMHHLLHGRVFEALDKNPLFVLSIPFLILLLLRPKLTRVPWISWTATGVVIAFGVLRHLPVPPFTHLTP